jgi:cell division control protein 6
VKIVKDLASDIFDILDLGGKIFKNREVLRYSYIPDTLPHREKEIGTIARILIPALWGDTPSNIMIFGMTGTGKTVVSKILMKALYDKSQIIRDRNLKRFVEIEGETCCSDSVNELHSSLSVLDFEEILGPDVASSIHKSVNCIYINCQQMDTQYRVMTQIANRLLPFDTDERLPVSGLPIDEVHSRMLAKLDETDSLVLIILDEIDRLIMKVGDDILYTLTRINEDLKSSRVSIIGISNNLQILEYLEPRVRSSLGAEELVFEPYNAVQLKDILDHRAKEAFYASSCDDDVVGLCSAIAAQENGDARKALDLIRVSAELAERDHSPKLTELYVRSAQKKIETDRVHQVIKTLPLQSKLVLYSIIQLKLSGRVKTTTKEVVESYSFYSAKLDITVLGRRQVVNLLAELDKLGIIQTKVISFGRHGRTTVIESNVPSNDIMALLQNGLLSELKGLKPKLMYQPSF